MFCQFLFPKALSWPTQEKDGKHMNSRMRQRERELHLVLNVWLSGLGWAWRSIGCDWYNFSPMKSSCGDCCHVPTLEWNNVPWGPALHPNAFVTLWACMRHPSLDTCTVPCGLLSHIGMLRSLGQTEPQIEKTEKWDETQWNGDVDRAAETKTDRRIWRGEGRELVSPGKCSRLWLRKWVEEWLQHESLEKKRWRQSNTNMKKSQNGRGWGSPEESFMYHAWGRSTERIDRWEKQT